MSWLEQKTLKFDKFFKINKMRKIKNLINKFPEPL